METRIVVHAGCGAPVTRCSGEADGAPRLQCARGHHIVDPRELAPRPSGFTPVRRMPALWERVPFGG